MLINTLRPIGTSSLIIFVVYWSRYIWIYSMKTKTADEISRRFRGLLALLQTLSNA